jgi:DNA-3-methyladenine glycosylase
MKSRLNASFYQRDVLVVAPELLGKCMVRQMKYGQVQRHIITETEAYRGEEDLACHASKGLTRRTEVMYREGGYLYVYLIYGMYWMLNIVTGQKNIPQAVLIRGTMDLYGPGRITRTMHIDRSFYAENLLTSQRLWIEDTEYRPAYTATSRVGVEYAGEYWKNVKWRYVVNQ